MANTNKGRRRGIPRAAPDQRSNSGYDGSGDISAPARTGECDTRFSGTTAPDSLKANTRAWLQLWLDAGRPTNADWWAKCHHVIRAKLKEYVT